MSSMTVLNYEICSAATASVRWFEVCPKAASGVSLHRVM